MKKLNRKIIGRVCVGIVLLALVLWLMVDCLWELTFPDGPIRHADGGWYDPASNAIETLRFVYGADGTTAFFEVMDDGQDKQFVFSADGREPAETMDFLRVEPVDA